MPIVKHLLSFGGGELSPLLDGRTDIAKYNEGCRRLENFIPTPQGGLLKRPGLQRIGTVTQQDTNDATTFGQLVEFQITTHRSVVLALGGLRMMFVDKSNVVQVLSNPGNPDSAKVDFKIPIPWADTQLRLLRWKQVNNVMFFVHPEHAPRMLTRKNAKSWTLEVIDFGLNVALLDENVKRWRRITTAFKVDEDADSWETGENYEAGERVSNDDKKWVCRVDHESDGGNEPKDGATFVDPDDGVTKKIWRRSWSDADDGFQDLSSEVGQRITLTSTAGIFREGHVGSRWEIAARRGQWKYEVSLEASAATSETESKVLVVQGSWNFITFGTWAGSFIIEISTDQGETWGQHQVFRSTTAKPRNASSEGHEESRVLMRISFRNHDPDGTPGDSPGATNKPYAMLSTPEGRIRGLVRISQFVSETEVKAICLSPVEKGTTSVWSEGAWSAQQGFPRCIELHQNRLLLAATTRRPHTIWGSAVDDYTNFKRGTEADVAFVHTLAIGTRDPILWMDSGKTLVVGNGGGEFTLRGENADAPITPEFGICDRHSSFGTHQGGAGHIVADDISLFVQNGGRALREMGYSFQSDKYESANLNLLAEHLFKGPIMDVAVQRQPFQILWVVAGGQLFSLTYERSQSVVAWARHPCGGEVIAVGSVRRDAEDGMYFLIRRGPVLAIERFVPRALIEPKNDGSYLDSHTTITTGSGSYEGLYDLTGHPLRGRTVCGYRVGQLLKGESRVIGPAPLNSAFFTGVTGPVVLGQPFRALVVPMTPEVGLENGSSRSRECRIHGIVANLYQSRGGKIGQTPEGPQDALDVGSSTVLFSGEVEKNFDGGFNEQGNFCILSDEPYPFTIRSVALKLNYTGDVR